MGDEPVLSDLEKLAQSSIYAFNIVVEAKARALVDMTKRAHPDWTKEQVKEFLKNAIDHAIKKEMDDEQDSDN